MVDAMGGMNSPHYARFKSLCYTGFTSLRKNANLIINLVALMVDANIPDIKMEPDKAVGKVGFLPQRRVASGADGTDRRYRTSFFSTYRRRRLSRRSKRCLTRRPTSPRSSIGFTRSRSIGGREGAASRLGSYIVVLVVLLYHETSMVI